MEKFDEVINRRGTSCIKYDFAEERGLPADVLPLWVADMDFRSPEPVITELAKRSQHGIFGYSGIRDDYREVLSDWFRQQHGWNPDMKSLIITPGVVFAICTAIRAFTQEDAGVLICPPVYYPFSASIRDNHRRLVESTLVESNGRYEIDFVDFEQKIIDEQVKMFILCSPHNPVGRVWTKDELSRLAEICQRHHVLVVADEIHHDFIRPGHQHTVFSTLSDAVANNTITCTSPSKTFNLAGLQLSNIFIPNESLRRKFKQELLATGYGEPNIFGMTAAKAAYGQGLPWLTELKSYLEENLQRTKNYLAANLPKARLIEPEGTYLIWIDFSAYNLSDEVLDDLIINKGRVWLDSGHIFGAGGQGFQRINIACPWQVLSDGLSRLDKAFATI